jgi:hypothetical protein
MAPPGMVEAMASWLGLPAAESYGQDAGRGLLGVSEQLALLRGTRAGLELALSECFPHHHFEVTDHGDVSHAGKAEAPAAFPGFTIRCHQTLSPTLREQVQRAIEWQRPLHVRYTLLDGDDTQEPEMSVAPIVHTPPDASVTR